VRADSLLENVTDNPELRIFGNEIAIADDRVELLL
jgi:hypothetical protein